MDADEHGYKTITAAAAIRTACGLFEFGNDLHGAYLWRAAHRARRKCRAHQIVGAEFAANLPFDIGPYLSHLLCQNSGAYER